MTDSHPLCYPGLMPSDALVIPDAHRETPDFGAMTTEEIRAYCRGVWSHYVGPHLPPVTDRPDRDDVLAVLRAHTPPRSRKTSR